MGKTFNPFSFYGFTNSPHFEGVGKPISEKKVKELINSDIELKDKYLVGAEYDAEKNAIVFTVKDGENEETSKYYEVPIAKILEDADNGILSKKTADETYATEESLGEYAKSDDVTAEIKEAVSGKVDTETYEADKATFETKENAAATYQPIGEYLTETDLEPYAKVSDVETSLGTKADATAVTDSIDAAKAELDAKIDTKADATALNAYQTKDDAASEHAAIEGMIPSVADFFNGASYNEETKKIEFKNGETVKTTIDATPFIKDGMIEAVEVKDGKLVITFNTDAGEKDIEIELSEIFNADKYYTKDDTDEKLEVLATKEELADYAKTSEVNTKLENKVDTTVLEDYAKTTEVEEELAKKVNTEDLETALDGKQDKGDYAQYTKFVAGVSSKERKTIQLANADNISGVKTDGGGVNLVMVSEWNVADFGSTQLPINLNGKDERPTYNDEEEIALLSDVEKLETALDDKQDKGDYVVTTAMTDAINAAISASEAKIFGDGELAEAFDTIKEIGDYLKDNDDNVTAAINSAIATKLDKEEASETYQKKGDYLAYTPYIEGRKTVQLKNYDNISGLMTDGTGVNIAMVSKWDVADFGSVGLPINLNGSKDRPTYNDDKEIALLEDVPSLEGFVTKEDADETYQPKGEYLTEHQDISGLATKGEVSAVEGKIPSLEGYATEEWVEGKGYLTEHQSLAEYATLEDVENMVEYTTFEGTRKTISLNNRDTISANTPKGGSQIAMVSDYDGLDFPVVELGGQNGALVLNTREDRVKVEVIENGKRVQHSVATLDDLNDYPKYEPYVNGDINKKTIVLENDDNISGKRTDGLGVNLVEVSRWNVADFGSKSVHINLNGQYERPTYNDNKGIALLDDVEGLKNEMKDYVNALLKNYTLKSDDDIAKVIKGGGDVVVAKDVKATAGYTLTKDTTIDLNGHALDAVSNGNYGDNIVIGNGANVTIKNGVINEAENASEENASAVILIKTTAATTVTLEDVEVSGRRPVYLNNANAATTVTIKSGTFTCNGENGEAIYVQQGGKVTIEGGYFSNPNATTYKSFLLNIKDNARQGKDPREFIEVKGGTFVNFNPSNNEAEGANTNFVAEGYHVEISKDGDDTLYTVVKD